MVTRADTGGRFVISDDRRVRVEKGHTARGVCLAHQLASEKPAATSIINTVKKEAYDADA